MQGSAPTIVSICICVLVGCCVPSIVRSQPDSLQDLQWRQVAAAKSWMDNLYAHGVEIKGDSVYFNDETRLIVSNAEYNTLIYPDAYIWETVSGLMQQKALKQAVWYMINLYRTDQERRDLVLRLILPLDQTLEMDRVMLAAFYTYIAFDPEVYRVENGRTVEVLRPDIAEEKLLATKAIVDQIYAQREKMKTAGHYH